MERPLTLEDLEKALKAIKEGAGIISQYGCIVWNDPKTRARVMDLIASTAFQIREAADIASAIYDNLYNFERLRGTEAECLSTAIYTISKNKKKLEEIAAQVEKSGEGMPEVIDSRESF